MLSTPVSLLEQLRRPAADTEWRRFVEIYEPWLRRWLRTHVIVSFDIDDLVQDVLVVLLRELPRFQHNGRVGAFRTWLRGILLNRLRDFRRNAPVVADPDAIERRMAELADDRSELSLRWNREHDQNVVQGLLRTIAADFEPHTWQAFHSVVVDGCSAAETARRLGMTVGAVWSAKSHVLKRLRQTAKGLFD